MVFYEDRSNCLIVNESQVITGNSLFILAYNIDGHNREIKWACFDEYEVDILEKFSELFK